MSTPFSHSAYVHPGQMAGLGRVPDGASTMRSVKHELALAALALIHG